MTAAVWLIILIAMVAYGAGEYTSKLYGAHPSFRLGAYSMLAYMVSCLMFLVGMQRFNSLSVLGMVWTVLYSAITLSIAVLCFHEPLSVRQWIGIGFGLISIVMLSS